MNEKIDPRSLLDFEPLTSFDEVKEGDWVAAGNWTRPRRVELEEHRNDERVMFLADPDPKFEESQGVRAVNRSEFEAREPWRRYPNLRKLWDSTQG